MSDQKAQLTRREKVEVREQAILDAARDVFIERGYDGARMVEIAQRAGIAEGTIYLYYRTKTELMKAVVGAFWIRLTADAKAAVRSHDDPFTALHALARFHLRAVIERFDVIGLSRALPDKLDDPTALHGELKTYVSVFDEIFRRGIDRGVVAPDAVLWMARDVFYGSLEYSARTLMQRGQHFDADTVDNLMALLRTHYSPAPSSVSGPDQDPAALMARLESAVDRLEQI